MANIMGVTRGGQPWEPQFIVAIDQKLCIGCGRCYQDLLARRARPGGARVRRR
jgi:hypothetical protein